MKTLSRIRGEPMSQAATKLGEETHIRTMIKLYYDIQKLRVAVGNRIKVKEFIRCPNGHLIPYPKRKVKQRKFTGRCPICGAEVEVVEVVPPALLGTIHGELRDIEKGIYAYIYQYVSKHKFWSEYLKYVKGIGPVLAAGLITILNPARFETVSKMWKYAGLHVEFACPHCGYVSDAPGRCPRCGMMLVGRAPRRVAGRKVSWNPAARHLCWLIGRSFQMTGGVYKGFYRKFLEESLRNPKHRDWTMAHHIAHARRVTTKLFLSHWYSVGREMMGLPWRKPYIVELRPHEYIPPVIDYVGDYTKDQFYRRYVKRVLEEVGLDEAVYESLIRTLNGLQNVEEMVSSEDQGEHK